MEERVDLEQCVNGLMEACLRNQSFFESVVRVLMCTVDFEDRLAKRKRVKASVKTVLTVPAPFSGSAPANGSQQELPLLLAFETVGGGVVYIADKGYAAVLEAWEKGVAEIQAEVYMPPYRLPSARKLTIERREPGWVTIVGGTPPVISVPVGSEEHFQTLLRLLELRGVKPEIR
ncbi:MAG: hypothetical protein QXF46_08795 [Thermofilaceae archaeon]